MADWNLGSIATQVHAMVDNIPSAISGAQLLNLIDKQRLRVENEATLSIGSTAINEKYQMAIVYYSCAIVQNIIQARGADVQNIKLGEFSISKGTTKSDSEGASWEALGDKEVDSFRSKYSTYRTW